METRRKFDEEFKEGAVRIVRETGKPGNAERAEVGEVCERRLSKLRPTPLR